MENHRQIASANRVVSKTTKEIKNRAANLSVCRENTGKS
jgi:hypothetical protein